MTIAEMMAMQQGQPPAPSGINPIANGQQQNPLYLMAQQIMQQMQQPQQQFDLSALLKPSRHLGMGGGEITADNPQGHAGGDPFTNGFFRTKEQRAQKEQDAFGVPGITSATPEQQFAARMNTIQQQRAAGVWQPPGQITGQMAVDAFGLPAGQQQTAGMRPMNYEQVNAAEGAMRGQLDAFGRPMQLPLRGQSFMTPWGIIGSSLVR